MPNEGNHPSFSELVRVSARIGCLSFGGPVGQIALMHRELVEERQWVTEDQYLHALNLCHLLPGPEAQQLAIWIGWKLHGLRGGLAAGLLFVIPGALVILALSILYGYAAELSWFAAITDVAVLEIDPKDIPSDAATADLQCNAMPRVGTPVAIFGHPGSLSYTATRGIISSISWVFPTEIIQSDATVNGGNSGGPLIDLSTGKIVGIAAASFRDTNDDHSTAVSFSEPIPPVCQILDLLKAGRDARYRQLPAAYATAEDDDRPIVATVFDPASGLKVGDRIVAINGRGEVRNTSDLASRLRGNEAMVNVTVERDGREVALSLATRVMPEITRTKSIDLSGLVISNQWKLDSAEFQHEGYLFIDFTRPGSAAEMTEAYGGQHLVALNNRAFTDLDQLYNYLQSLPAESDVNLILKAASNEQPFYRQYHLVTLPRGEPRWLEAARPADD